MKTNIESRTRNAEPARHREWVGGPPVSRREECMAWFARHVTLAQDWLYQLKITRLEDDERGRLREHFSKTARYHGEQARAWYALFLAGEGVAA